MEQKVEGNLVIIGGAEDKDGECEILKEVTRLAGGKKACLIIVTAATKYPKKVGGEYKEIFSRLGVSDIKLLNVGDRRDAQDQDLISILDDATCIFFTGGDQLRITSLIGGTRLNEKLFRKYEKGVVLAGTSAGASVMSETMVVEGEDDDAPRKCTLKMAPGLGLLEGVVIDQHFAQRGRIGRLLSAVAQNPHILGIGIDEDTAVHVTPDGVFKVLGSQAVTILDGKDIHHTNVSELNPNEILSITNVRLHVLPPGYKFDLRTRRCIDHKDQKDK
ncbi:MAG: cyanophycinase [Mahellales bacterium]